MGYGNEISNKFETVTFPSSSTDQFETRTIQGRRNKQILLRRVFATCGTAASFLDVCIPKHKYKTTLNTATAAAATTGVILDGDDDGYIGGHQITSNDLLLISTDGGADASNQGNAWRLCSISAHVETAASDIVTITVAGLDGITGIENACSAGAECYIIRPADKVQIPVGNATVEKEYWASGEVNAPVVFYMDPAGATAHDFNALAEFVGPLS